jgi:GTP cyclohydrolase III
MPKAMRACKFILGESADRTKQMAIRRLFLKDTGSKSVAHIDVIGTLLASTTTVSP